VVFPSSIPIGLKDLEAACAVTTELPNAASTHIKEFYQISNGFRIPGYWRISKPVWLSG
jgi:hypothetical protein